MDRGKSGGGSRGQKGKVTQQPPDTFIALGAKQPALKELDPKRPGVSLGAAGKSSSSSSSHLQPGTSKSGAGGSADRKRDASRSGLSLPSSSGKKLKTNVLPARTTGGSGSALSLERPGPSGSAGGSAAGGAGGGNGNGGAPAASTVEPWESLAVECEPSDLFEETMAQANNGSQDRAIGLILGALKLLRSQRYKPDRIVYCSTVLLCQCKPILFTDERIVTAITSSLKRDVSASFKTPGKAHAHMHLLYICCLMYAFNDVPHWPESLVKIYVEDALCDRLWIENPYCKPFVDNIVTAFNTKQPSKILYTSDTWLTGGRDTSSPLTVNTIDEDDVFNEHKVTVEGWKIKVFPRYSQNPEVVEKISLEAIQEQIARRQPDAITKNFVRFLSTACGLVEIRMLAVSRIETWLHNHKLSRPAQELLAYVCYNCSARTQRDIDIIAQLSKLRLKNKPLVSMFNNCLKEMVVCFPENLYPLLKYTIYSELSNARNTNNLVVVGAMFQVAPEASADAFADICLELLLNKDDYLRSLRALLKEINRVLRHDFNLLSVTHALLRERPDVTNVIRDFEYRERMFHALADLICMCVLLCVNPQVRDAASQSKRDVAVLQAFQSQVSNIQREAVAWLHNSAVRVFRPGQTDFVHVLHKVLFLAPAEEYSKADGWPGENERNVFLRLSSEVPLLQATLLRILLIGLSKEHPMGQTDVMETLDQLVKRAANLPSDGMSPLVMDKTEIIEFFFNLSSYNYHENIVLPAGYVPPHLAISSLYWKAWMILLILAAHNPTTFGNLAWNKYPTLRTMMEMCITNHFSFPPPTMVAGIENFDDYTTKELQLIALERQTIIEFESHLAAASTKKEITEQTSLLLAQLMELKPHEMARKPPLYALEQLQSLNGTHRLGHLLCRSRNPDFLLDIMSRQGGTAQMPWLAELVHNSEGTFAHLPVQCLCEYLLSTIPTEKLTKHGQLLAHLRTVVNGSDPQSACEVLEYLLRRLTSIHAASRVQAIKGLTLILNPGEDNDVGETVVCADTQWLTQYIPLFIHTNAVKPLLVQFLRQALFVETNPVHVSDYVHFLATQDHEEASSDLLELVLDLASIIVERSCITSHLLPGRNYETLKALVDLFCFYLRRARQPNETETFHWSENQDQVVISWANGDQSTLQILIVHASIILLTYGPVNSFPNFDVLMNMWFPADCEHPKAYLADTSEEALLVPDWLKLRMIRSDVPSLVDSAIDKLKAPQLVLFIQSFGIPVVSISKLLAALDKVTLHDTKLVVDTVIDKSYMIQLVEVQNRRGAHGGELFVKALELHTPNLDDEQEMEIAVTRKQLPTMASNRLPELPANEPTKIAASLHAIFIGQSGQNSEFSNLIKSISNDPNVKNYIYKFLSGAPSNFIASLLERPQFSITLFKVLFNKKNSNKKSFSSAQMILATLTNLRPSPLGDLLRQFVKQSPSVLENEPTVVLTATPTTSDRPSVDSILSKSVVTSRMLSGASESADNLSGQLGRLLLVDSPLPAEKAGLVVDWLYSLELDVVDPARDDICAMELLFSRRNPPFRPLLISLLLQRCNWTTLYGVVGRLLGGAAAIATYSPASVLDFLTALMQSPKLWQGRDKGVPKHSSPEDVLQLSSDQVVTLVSYILEETDVDNVDWKNVLESRLDLLLKSIGNSSQAVTQRLLNTANTDPKSRELLTMLYLAIPSIQKYLCNFDKSLFAKSLYSKTSSSSTVDVISHTIVSALGATLRAKDWTRKSYDLETLARKLTATHPELVLRQLPMLAGCLRGRAQYDFVVLRNRGHYLLFNQIMGLLELLQPAVFEQREVLGSILDSYFDLLQYHGHSKDLTSCVSRLVVFLQNWLTKDVRSALRYLQKHGQLLNELQLSQPSVRPLLSSVSLPVQEQSGSSGSTNEVLVGTVTLPVPEPLPQQWPAVISSLQSSDPLSGLQELDHLANKRPKLLMSVSQHLYNFLDSPNGNVRSLSMTLLVKLLKSNPKESREALTSVMTCLNHRNPDVVQGVLDRLPDIVVCMQEYAVPIMRRVFQLSVNSNLSAATSISKTIATLSLQFGC